MDYMNEFLGRLQKGANVDTLAAELTKALNEANVQFQKQHQEEQRIRNDKINCLVDIFEALEELLTLYGAKEDELPKTSVQEFEDLVDELDELVPVLREDPFKALKDLAKEEEKSKCVFPDNLNPSWKDSKKDPIEEFLNKFVR